jgi:hypothetical protein
MALPHLYRSYSIYLIGNAIPDVNPLATVAQGHRGHDLDREWALGTG